jgi:hypothetical protein
MFKELAKLPIGEIRQLAKTVQAVVVEDRTRSCRPAVISAAASGKLSTIAFARLTLPLVGCETDQRVGEVNSRIVRIAAKPHS